MGEPFPTYPKTLGRSADGGVSSRRSGWRLDTDGVDAEVLFPNPPGGTFFESGDADYELDVVRAYNDTLSRMAPRQRSLLAVGDPALFEFAGNY